MTPGSGCANYPFGEISKKHGNTLVSKLRKIDAQPSQPAIAGLSNVLEHLNETSLSQLVHAASHVQGPSELMFIMLTPKLKGNLMALSPSRLWLLSVTESVALPPD